MAGRKEEQGDGGWSNMHVGAVGGRRSTHLLRVAGASGHGRAVVAQNGQAETAAPAGGGYPARRPARRPARWGCRGSCGHRLGDEGTEPGRSASRGRQVDQTTQVLFSECQSIGLPPVTTVTAHNDRSSTGLHAQVLCCRCANSCPPSELMNTAGRTVRLRGGGAVEREVCIGMMRLTHINLHVCSGLSGLRVHVFRCSRTVL